MACDVVMPATWAGPETLQAISMAGKALAAGPRSVLGDRATDDAATMAGGRSSPNERESRRPAMVVETAMRIAFFGPNGSVRGASDAASTVYRPADWAITERPCGRCSVIVVSDGAPN